MDASFYEEDAFDLAKFDDEPTMSQAELEALMAQRREQARKAEVEKIMQAQLKFEQEKQAAKERDQKELEEKQRLYEEEVQKRNQELKERAERIENYKNIIKDCQEQLNIVTPKFNELQEFCNKKNKELNDLDRHKTGGHKIRALLVHERETMESDLEKKEKEMRDEIKLKDYKKEKQTAKEKLDQQYEKLQIAKKELKDLDADLRSVQLEFAIVGGEGLREGLLWENPQVYLEKQFASQKAIRDMNFAAEQKVRDQDIEFKRNDIEVAQELVDKFIKDHPWLRRTKEESQQLDMYEKSLKAAKNALSDLEKENDKANKLHDKEEKAKLDDYQKNFKKNLEEATKNKEQLQENYRKIMHKHDAIAEAYDLKLNAVSEMEDNYQKAVDKYNEKYTGKHQEFNQDKYDIMVKQKDHLIKEIAVKNKIIEKHDYITENWDSLKKAILDVVTPKGLELVEVQTKKILLESKMEKAQNALAEEEKDLPGLNNPSKKNDPQNQNSGRGMGGPMGH